MDDLAKAIADAQKYFSDPPINEQSTCDWVILPLLRAAGYTVPTQILPKALDSGGEFPDYTLFKDQPREFYLEAKAWKTDLDERHERQTVNYTNHNGKQWAVLTNGRVWYLYNNQIQGKVGEKRVMGMHLERQVAASCIP